MMCKVAGSLRIGGKFIDPAMVGLPSPPVNQGRVDQRGELPLRQFADPRGPFRPECTHRCGTSHGQVGRETVRHNPIFGRAHVRLGPHKRRWTLVSAETETLRRRILITAVASSRDVVAQRRPHR